jgi:hypothetical protein
MNAAALIRCIVEDLVAAAMQCVTGCCCYVSFVAYVLAAAAMQPGTGCRCPGRKKTKKQKKACCVIAEGFAAAATQIGTCSSLSLW